MTRPTSIHVILLERIAKGDRDAMRALYVELAPIAQRFAMTYVSDSTDAADVVQNAMLAIWKYAARFDNRSSVKTWVLSITRNKAIDHVRKVSRITIAEADQTIPDEAPSPEEIVLASQDHERIRHCMTTLSDRHRSAIHLAFFEDLTYREVAAIEQVSENTIKTRIFHAKKLLLHCMTQT